MPSICDNFIPIKSTILPSVRRGLGEMRLPFLNLISLPTPNYDDQHNFEWIQLLRSAASTP